jgi:hypothetical protein
MGRLKRDSKVLGTLAKRISGLGGIAPNLDLGAGITIAAMQKGQADLQTKLDKYNAALAKADAALNDVLAVEKRMGELASRALSAVAAQYGKDSNEYELAGGVRTSERARYGAKKAALAKKTAKATAG